MCVGRRETKSGGRALQRRAALNERDAFTQGPTWSPGVPLKGRVRAGDESRPGCVLIAEKTMGGTVQEHIGIAERRLPAAAGNVTALRADFVAKPETIGSVREGIEERILTSWGKEQGFLTGMVLVSDQEARLTTLITFWKAGALERTREQKLRWLQKILKPYADRCLHVRTNSTYFLTAESAIEEMETAQGFSAMLSTTPALCAN